MKNDIFTTAIKFGDILRNMGYLVEVTTHPTSWGNSAYITYRMFYGNYYKERGIRLSDHPTGERRKATDLHQTIIFDNSITPETLFRDYNFSDDDKKKLMQYAEKMTVRKKAQEIENAEKERNRIDRLKDNEKFNMDMVKARNEYFHEFMPEFYMMNQTKQRPLIKKFNRYYRQSKKLSSSH